MNMFYFPQETLIMIYLNYNGGQKSLEQFLGRGGGYSQKNWVGVCSPLPKTLTLFMNKICDFPYPIYDLTKNLIPYLSPDSWMIRPKGFCCWLYLACIAGVNGI